MLANSAIFKLIMSYVGMIVSDGKGSLTIYLGIDGFSYMRVKAVHDATDAVLIDFTAGDSEGHMIGYATETVRLYRVMELSEAMVFGTSTIFFDAIKSIDYNNVVVYTKD